MGNTAFGPIAFLACEAIGGALTISYAFQTRLPSVFCSMLMFVIVCDCVLRRDVRVDVDLLTRGAGFGYMGSTITSLIYASFTFLLFAIEASIMSMALTMMFDIPLWLAHLISALVVIPIAIYGISLISKMQLVTQPVWLILQILPLAYIAWKNPQSRRGLSSPARRAPPTVRSTSCCSVWRAQCCFRYCRKSASKWTTCASCLTRPKPIASVGGPQ